MSHKLHQWQTLAQSVAQEAGDYLKKGLQKSKQINFEDAHDVKLQADLDSEALIRDRLSKSHLNIIGEEGGGDEALLDSDEYFWVVDPLDGTYNYLRDQKETCVSIGLMKGSNFKLGVIYNFNSDEIIAGHVNSSTTLNSNALPNQWAASLDQACVMTGFPSGFDRSQDSLIPFFNKLNKFKKVRMIGSAALALAQVALKRADAYYEEDTKLWDIAAGSALVLASGGHVQFQRLSNFSLNLCAVAKPEWFNQINLPSCQSTSTKSS